MSNHRSAGGLRFPGDDARLDLTDLFVFGGASPGQTTLIMDVNPYTSGMTAMPPFLMRSDLHPEAVYRISVDNDGDAQADVAFSFVFSELRNGMQAGTVYYATGGAARQAEPAGNVLMAATPVGFDASAEPVPAGPGRLFVGIRSDPFLADADGACHGARWTGPDAFANRNILALALEVPDPMLGADPQIGVWASVWVRRDGELVQVDRGGHPTISPLINPNEEAAAAASVVLPDILRYDRTQPAAYPNGRALTDDNLLTEFPYLGLPNRYPAG